MKVWFHTLGCKVNQYETEIMRRLMKEQGWDSADYTPGAHVGDDVVVINSCTVTGESDRKLRQLLRRCRRDNPQAILVLTGCMPQAFPEAAEHFYEADIVLGNAARAALPRHIHAFLTLGQRIVDIPAHDRVFEALPIREFEGHTRAFVKIEDGCDRFCSYCIIPYARGRVRSKTPETLREELEALAVHGYREVVLVGINLTAYGKEWGGSLCDAVDIACAVTAGEHGGFCRVRLGSLEPDYLTPEVLDRLARQPKLCPQFHLSLQSGCDATLRRMNRHYTAAEYAALCTDLRARFVDCALTTDVMVGFPGEDEEEFSQSLAFVETIGFSRVHVFAYSRRPGTLAASAAGQVTAAEKNIRSHRMTAACERIQEEFLRTFRGRTMEVLLENRRDACGAEGYTANYLPVRLPHTGSHPGELVPVRIVDTGDGVCVAEELPS